MLILGLLELCWRTDEMTNQKTAHNYAACNNKV